MSEQSVSKRDRTRSPSYPSVDLETAVARANQLYEHERQHAVPAKAAVAHWGYTTLNGPGGQQLAALKKFGLVDYEGNGADRRVRLTDLAVRILKHPSAPDRMDAIKKAALMPAIHRELWDKYGPDLPSDATLHWELTRERSFTETGANEFLPEYRDTIAWAGLHAGDTVGAQTDSSDEDDEDLDVDDEGVQDDTGRDKSQRRQRRKRMTTDLQTYAVPVAAGVDVTIEGEFPLTEQQWTQFLAVLTAMKPGLVTDRWATEQASDDED